MYVSQVQDTTSQKVGPLEHVLNLNKDLLKISITGLPQVPVQTYFDTVGTWYQVAGIFHSWLWENGTKKSRSLFKDG